MGVDFEREKRNHDPRILYPSKISPLKVDLKNDTQTCQNQYISSEPRWKKNYIKTYKCQLTQNEQFQNA